MYMQVYNVFFFMIDLGLMLLEGFIVVYMYDYVIFVVD